MNPKLATLLTVAGMAGISGSYVPTAAADQINVIATQCRAAVPGQLTATTSGLFNQTQAPVTVFCSLPHTPLTTGATQGTFFIDGANSPGRSTQCTLVSFDFTGNFLGSNSQTSFANANYSMEMSLLPSELPTFAYTAVSCQIPVFGRLTGITSIPFLRLH